MSFLSITSFKILTVASLLLALFKVIVHTLFSSPQSSKELKIASKITTPEYGGVSYLGCVTGRWVDFKENTKGKWNHHCERPRWKVTLKKRDSGTFLGHLSFWVSGMELPLIFLYTMNVQIVYKTPWTFRPPIYKTPLQAYYQTIYVRNMNIS